jgi:hypothetical protein
MYAARQDLGKLRRIDVASQLTLADETIHTSVVTPAIARGVRP